jgi:PAS domain S-box-containing protein
MTEFPESRKLPPTSLESQTKILLVGDNPANVVPLCAILQELHVNLVEAHSGEEAVQYARSEDVAVMLLDVLMPGISGYETAKLIRGNDRSRYTPIIFLTTGALDRSDLEHGYALGAVDVLIKPVAPIILLAKVRGFVELFLEKERAKREANQLRLLVQATTDYAIFMLDPDGRIATWNAGAERLKGYKADEIIGQHFSRFYSPEARERGWPQHELEVARREGRFEDEGWRLRKDGTQFWANVVITALFDEAGSFKGFSKITRDLTERKRAEEHARALADEVTARRAAQEERERLRVTLSSIGDAVISTDVRGSINFLNSIAEELVGWTNEEAISRTLTEVFQIVNEETRQPVENPVLRALRDGRIVGLANHTILISKDGTERPIDDSAAPIRDANGGVVGCVLVFRDASELRRADQHRNARLAVTNVLNDAEPVTDGESGVLRAVCKSLAWDVGFVWIVNDQGTALECRRSWHRPEVPVAGFETATCNRTFEKGHGLPGRVWQSGKPAWIVNIKEDTNFPRLASAVTNGLHSAIACPIAVGRTLGVIEFFTKHIRKADAELLEMISTIAGSLGQFIERKTAEKELRKSEQQLADFFENASVGLHWVGSDGTILRANRAELDLLGYALNEYIGHNIAEFHVDADVICDILHRLTAGEHLQGYEARMRCKDGSVRYVLINSNVLWEDGKFIHTRCFARDITAWKQAEQALKESVERFRQLADAMPQIVWTARSDGQVDYMNRRWTEFTGLPDTVGNEAWGSLLHPDDAPSARERWAASVQSGAPFEMELRLLDRRLHSYRWHLIRTAAVKDEAGRVVRWFGTSTEIHEQKRAEESSRFLAEASAALAGVVDYESTLQKVAKLAVPYFADWSAIDIVENGGLRRLAVSHLDPDKIQLAYKLVRDYPPDPHAKGGIGAVVRTGKAEMLSDISDDLLQAAARDKEHLTLMRALGLRSYVCVPLVVSGETVGVLTFATAESGRRYTDSDLSLATDLAHRAAVAIENIRLYEALRNADRRKDEFLATLAHELRNPLAPIRNSLEILKMPRLDSETLARSRDMMDRQVQQLIRLVDDLLDVSRVMRGKIELRKERVELASIVARAVETAQPLIDAHMHTLSVSLPDESLPLDADPVRLSQVVSNLLTNAAKYTDLNGRIGIMAAREGDEAVVRVRDTGIGLAPDLLPHVFDLFVQADHTTTKAQGGLGIGLTLVKNLVEMHEGSVSAHSAGLGQGCEFVVRLPLAKEGVLEHRHGEGEPLPGKSTGQRLLIVDDKRDAAESLALWLRLQGHEVRVAYDGPSALRLLAASSHDLVFLDIGMPGMDGYEVARRVRTMPGMENVVLVALTGWGQLEDRRRTAEAGFNHHLVKPADPKALEQVLSGLFGRNTDA